MTTPYPANEPLLTRAYEPIRFECEYADLAVEGELPSALRGSFYRIGPNPQYPPRGRYNPLQGDGMVHAFHFADGRVGYRNRWVRTVQWSLERAAGRALFATSGDPRDADPSVAGVRGDGVANTHVVWHANRLLALEEGHAPIEIDPVSLDTRGPFSFDGRLPGNMTAHPKIDPDTGELLFFANFPNRAFDATLAFHVADAHGALRRSETLQGPFPALVHDFAITRNYAVFIVCPVTLSLERLRAGRSPIAWEPALGTHVAVVPRHGSPDARWYRGDACMAWHTLNAFEDGECIHVDVCSQRAPAFPAADGTPIEQHSLRQHLCRWTLRPGANDIDMAQLSALVCEYPRIDERRTGAAYRYGYFAAVGGPGTDDPFQRAIARFDHATGTMQTHHFGAHSAVSEPVFVPRGDAEGDGWLLATVYDERRNASHLAIIDAQRISDGPVARARLDHRVPAGFHGTWRQSET